MSNVHELYANAKACEAEAKRDAEETRAIVDRMHEAMVPFLRELAKREAFACGKSGGDYTPEWARNVMTGVMHPMTEEHFLDDLAGTFTRETLPDYLAEWVRV